MKDCLAQITVLDAMMDTSNSPPSKGDDACIQR